MYSERDAPEKSKLHPLIIMIKLSVAGSTVQNDQNFICHPEEEESREDDMQINILM